MVEKLKEFLMGPILTALVRLQGIEDELRRVRKKLKMGRQAIVKQDHLIKQVDKNGMPLYPKGVDETNLEKIPQLLGYWSKPVEDGQKCRRNLYHIRAISC